MSRPPTDERYGIPCPALDGHDALGFLAAVGLLRLLADHGDQDAALSWSATDATAIIRTTTAEDTDGIARWLTALVDSIPPGQVTPETPANVPPPGEAPDRIRLAPADLRAYIESAAVTAGSAVHRWVGSMVTDLAQDDRGRSAISLFAAPSGKQSMRTMLEKPLGLIRGDPRYLKQALDGWVRVAGCTGEYLDHRALYDAADAPDGRQGQERGVPGATWLALMSYPAWRTTSINGATPITSGWRADPNVPVFEWPLWTPPLTMPAVQALVEHPAVYRDTADAPDGRNHRGERGRTHRVEQELGVFALPRARRRRIPGRNFAGVLAPEEAQP